MGLDMYLTKQTYVGNNYKDPKDQLIIKAKEIKQGRVSHISEQVGYWRKANAIHYWFVINVRDGDDDCKEYYVSREQLQDLLNTVNIVLSSTKLMKGKVYNGSTYRDGREIKDYIDGMVLADPTKAIELLPSQPGFFFGSTDYDENYWNDLLETKKILEEALSEEHGDFYYQSSW